MRKMRKMFSKKQIKRRSKKNRSSTKKYKGGSRYGRGIGSNCYDPNQSIYNTNMLKLFPYKS